jgi:hypothetical protein
MLNDVDETFFTKSIVLPATFQLVMEQCEIKNERCVVQLIIPTLDENVVAKEIALRTGV